METNAGKVREICQSENVETMKLYLHVADISPRKLTSSYKLNCYVSFSRLLANLDQQLYACKQQLTNSTDPSGNSLILDRYEANV